MSEAAPAVRQTTIWYKLAMCIPLLIVMSAFGAWMHQRMLGGGGGPHSPAWLVPLGVITVTAIVLYGGGLIWLTTKLLAVQSATCGRAIMLSICHVSICLALMLLAWLVIPTSMIASANVLESANAANFTPILIAFSFLGLMLTPLFAAVFAAKKIYGISTREAIAIHLALYGMHYAVLFACYGIFLMVISVINTLAMSI